MRQSEIDVIEKFITNFEHLTLELENYSKYLKLGENVEHLRDDAIGILKRKLKKMKNSESEKDLKKILKVNKILEKGGL